MVAVWHIWVSGIQSKPRSYSEAIKITAVLEYQSVMTVSFEKIHKIKMRSALFLCLACMVGWPTEVWSKSSCAAASPWHVIQNFDAKCNRDKGYINVVAAFVLCRSSVYLQCNVYIIPAKETTTKDCKACAAQALEANHTVFSWNQHSHHCSLFICVYCIYMYSFLH